MDTSQIKSFVDAHWDKSIIPALCDFIRIPAKSPLFDPDWAANGHIDAATELALAWCREQDLPGLEAQIVRLPGRTPVLFVEIPGTVDDTVLMYGHLDKQPEFDGWDDDKAPWKPVIQDGKVYGRGSADDGYAVFGSVGAVQALANQNLPHARCVLVIECCEESGSADLPYYFDALADRIGQPSLVVCLDASCGNYDQLWCTTTLRGNLVGTLTVDVLTAGVHSGGASGIVPDSFRILRHVLSRVEDDATGAIVVDELNVPIPDHRVEQATATGRVLQDAVAGDFPWAGTTSAVSADVTEQLLANTWRPTLTITGAEGLPSIDSAGNVLRPSTQVKLSFRLPPSADPAAAADAVKRELERDPPHGARVHFDVESAMGGWNAPAVSPWLYEALLAGSRDYFGRDVMYMGTGGSIPLMGMLGEKFPGVQFLVTGLLGPHSNAHGPNEFLHIATGKAITACVARALYAHGQNAST